MIVAGDVAARQGVALGVVVVAQPLEILDGEAGAGTGRAAHPPVVVVVQAAVGLELDAQMGARALELAHVLLAQHAHLLALVISAIPSILFN